MATYIIVFGLWKIKTISRQIDYRDSFLLNE